MSVRPLQDHCCSGPINTTMYRDPVCGMQVSATTRYTETVGGHTWYFCSQACLERFHQPRSKPPAARSVAPPAEGVAASGSAYTCPMHPEVHAAEPGACPQCGMGLERETVASPRTQYTCPMHPEVVRDAPGDCPICGMALEAVTVGLEDEENPELTDMTRRLKVSAALTVPLVIVAMGEVVGLSFDWLASPRSLSWLELALATPVVLWGGWARSWDCPSTGWPARGR